MKTVFVVGFFDPVKKVLDERYPRYLETHSVIWIRQVGRNREANLGELAERLFDTIAPGSTQILVLLGVPRGSEWIVDAVEAMLAKARGQHPVVEIDLTLFENLGDKVGVQNAILGFEPLDLGEISSERIRQKIGQGRVLCISLEGKTKIADALERANFTNGAITECFVEERIEGARNSNMMEFLNGKAKHYGHLLYAWDGLRTLKPQTKGKYAICFEAPTATMVVDLFRRWILSESV